MAVYTVFFYLKRRKVFMDLDKLIQNYEDIIEMSKQTTADLEKTLALLKAQKLNQEKELSLNVTESIAYEAPRVQEQRDLTLQNGYSKKDASPAKRPLKRPRKTMSKI